MTEESWVQELDRQWAVLHHHERAADDPVRFDLDPWLATANLERAARAYARAVRDAPPVALLRHASNLRRATVR